MVQGKINRGRHTDHPTGRHSIRTNQCPPPPSRHFFTGRMPFLPPNQQCQNTEGRLAFVMAVNWLLYCNRAECYVVCQNIFQFWLDKGVDALSINDIRILFESDDTALDEPVADDEAPPVCVFYVVFISLYCDILSQFIPLGRLLGFVSNVIVSLLIMVITAEDFNV